MPKIHFEITYLQCDGDAANYLKILLSKLDLKIEFHGSGNEVGKFNWFIFRTASEGRYLLLWCLYVGP